MHNVGEAFDGLERGRDVQPMLELPSLPFQAVDSVAIRVHHPLHFVSLTVWVIWVLLMHQHVESVVVDEMMHN